jgi:cardiolipin synthase
VGYAGGTEASVSSSAITLTVSTIAFLVDLGVKIAALIYLPRNRKPTSAMAWLLAVFLVPYVGIVAFLFIGNSKLGKKRRDKQTQINAMITAGASGIDLVTDQSTWPPWLASIVTMNERLGAVPLAGGNSATLVADYEASIAAMTAEIDTAATFVHVEFYIVALDDTTRDFFRAMADAVRRGVTVRVLMDHVASTRVAVHKQTIAALDRSGVKWSYMLPIMPFKGKYQRPDLRNHRKLVVVDGRVGFMGSQNLINRNYDSSKNIKRGLQWQELMVRVVGPAVAGINVVFLSDWYLETGEFLGNESLEVIDIPVTSGADALDCQVVPSGPGFPEENNLRMFLNLIFSAQKKVIITSPYFVPDAAMMYAITSACQRGLDVQLFVSEIGDQAVEWHAQRSYYGQLLEAGVSIWQYPAPFILHAKHLSIDDDVAVIGSSNMDIRSFSLNFEVCLLVRSKSFVNDMRAIEGGYRAIGKRLTVADWAAQSEESRILDAVARLTSALQ